MATFSRVTLLAFAAGVALGVSGCVAAPAVPVEPEPVSGATPVFASEEEALAAATEAYAAYLEVLDRIAADGGAEVERLESYVTSDYHLLEASSFEQFRAQGYFSSGSSEFDSVRLQQDSRSLTAGDRMTAYLCSDISLVRLVDSGGTDITPVGRTDRLPLEIDFLIAAEEPVKLLIARSDVWSGTNFC